MSRHNTFIVVLESDTKAEDTESLLTAIRQLRGVLTVEPNVSDISQVIADARAKSELEQKLWEVLYPKKKEG
jgi:nitrate reductase NapAB chaperone NapD